MLKKIRKALKRKKTPKPKYKKLEFCKPCWELKYCPYGIVVETMPLVGPPDFMAQGKHYPMGETWDEMYARAVQTLKETDFTKDDEIWSNMFFVLYSDQNKWNYVKDYNPKDVCCNIFGHVCPAFFYARLNVSETKQQRVRGRHIPREIMLQVIRRDDYRCRVCGKHVEDWEVEFDHIIPHAKGGPLTVENIRLLCRSCNRKKSDSLKGLIHTGALEAFRPIEDDEPDRDS